MTTTPTTILHLHENIKLKLDGFYKSQRIPHLLFHGSSGTGKRTLVYDFINKIYDHDKQKLKTNVMFVNCAHGKGIKFIRDELKFFAKTNINGTQGVSFKTIVLFNADSLTIDAQSALRRCIELFSYNTRFFIVVENKHKLLNPILSRFCEIYVPEYMDLGGNVVNLHQHHLRYKYGELEDRSGWFAERVPYSENTVQQYNDWVNVASDAYEHGLSAFDLLQWIKRSDQWSEIKKVEVVMKFQEIKSEYRCERLLMLVLLDVLFR
jgi:hypothetical protein